MLKTIYEGLMFLTNWPLADYAAQRKAGLEPQYNALRAGVTQKTDFWL